jgi:hypothetical protein
MSGARRPACAAGDALRPAALVAAGVGDHPEKKNIQKDTFSYFFGVKCRLLVAAEKFCPKGIKRL